MLTISRLLATGLTKRGGHWMIFLSTVGSTPVPHVDGQRSRLSPVRASLVFVPTAYVGSVAVPGALAVWGKGKGQACLVKVGRKWCQEYSA